MIIKEIARTVVVVLIGTAVATALSAFLGILDLSDFAPFIDLAADIIDPILTNFDLLLTTFPLTLIFILYFSFLGIVRLVVAQFVKE